MTNQLAHFAINADDVSRAREFYESVFDWHFTAFGPPEFFQIETGESQSGVRGALQKRREIVPGKAMTGFECTIAVANIDDAVSSITRAGGKIVMAKTTIAGVGHLVFFEDPEGNVVGAMQYDAEAE